MALSTPSAAQDWNNQASSDVYAYTPNTNTWTQVASMPTEHAFFGAAVGNDGTIYAIGGENGTTYMMGSEADAYNPNTNTWVQVASLPPIVYGGTEWVGRYQLTATAGKDSTIYVIGGVAPGVGVTSSVMAYNPTTNSWTQVAWLPKGRSGLAASTGIDGGVYAIGGYTEDGPIYSMNDVDIYNPTSNTWTPVASLPPSRENGGRDLGATTGINGTVYVIGGWNRVWDGTSYRDSPSQEVDAYTPPSINLTVNTLVERFEWSNSGIHHPARRDHPGQREPV